MVLKIRVYLDGTRGYRGAYAPGADAMEQVQKYGTMTKSPTGYPVQSPYVAVANRQAEKREIMTPDCCEFGFTPASRSRIAMPRDKQPSLFDFDQTDEDSSDEAEKVGQGPERSAH